MDKPDKIPGKSKRLWIVQVVLFLGLLLLAVAVFVVAFRGVILNNYAKAKIERAFAAANPGSSLRIGKLEYGLGANRLFADSVSLESTNVSLAASHVTLTGVRWAQLIRGRLAIGDFLAHARIEAADFHAQFPKARYGIRSAHLRASLPDSELIAKDTQFKPLAGDEPFFAEREFRTTRFHIVVPECRVLGLAYKELFEGVAYRAQALHLVEPQFEALVNREKPPAPFEKSPLMVHEALAGLRQPMQLELLRITNGRVRYAERMTVDAEPAVLTFGSVNLAAEGIGNPISPHAAIELEGQGHFMNAATLRVQMTIPIRPETFSLHYSGSLDAMDLSELNPFLERAERIRINSGSTEGAQFEIEVRDGQARGRVRGIYEDLNISLLDKQTGAKHRITSLLANLLKIRTSNDPDAMGEMRVGNVSYTRAPEDAFFKFVWLALRSGVLDLISR
jgi:hypothetical protein